MLTKPLILSALAAVAVAQLPGGAVLQARVLNDLDSTPSCSSARDNILSVYSQLPTPAAILDDAALPTGLCQEASLTGETAKAWSSFTSGAIAVLAPNSALIASAFSACPDLVGRVANFASCVTAAPTSGATTAPASGATATPAPTGSAGSKTDSGAPAKATGTESGSESSPSPAANAAPRVGAIYGTVLGVAGLVGVVAAF